MNKRTINVLCLVGCAALILQTQIKARDAQDAADAAAARSRALDRKAKEARERARKAQQDAIDKANEEQRRSPGPTFYDSP